MKNLKSFTSGSRTFCGFMFSGNYNMPNDVFLKLYDIFLRTGVNYLDSYSDIQFLFWEINDESHFQEYVYSIPCNIKKFDEIDRLRESNFNINRLGLITNAQSDSISNYLDRLHSRYVDYLNSLDKLPRRNACRYTAMPDVKKYVFDKYGKKCLKCGSEECISLDHIIPVKKGGKNELDNLQPLCKSCNSSKGHKIIDYRNA